MSDTIKHYQCRHIFTEGRRCGSPSLRNEEFCYYHHTTRRPVRTLRERHATTEEFDITLPEDRIAIQNSIGQVLLRISRKEIDPKRAGLLLYGFRSPAPTSLAPNQQPAPPNSSKKSPPTRNSATSPHPPNSSHPPERISYAKIMREELDRWQEATQQEAADNPPRVTSDPKNFPTIPPQNPGLPRQTRPNRLASIRAAYYRSATSRGGPSATPA